MATLRRTMRDIPTPRGMGARVRLNGARDHYARLTRLASERRRLENELALWHQKVVEVTAHLRRIDEEMQRLSRLVQATEPRGDVPPQAWHEVEISY